MLKLNAVTHLATPKTLLPALEYFAQNTTKLLRTSRFTLC